MSLVVWAVDPSRIRRGHLNVTACSAVVRDADVGTFQVTALADGLTDRVVPGWRVIVQDSDFTVLSGPLTSIEPDLAEGTVTFGGVDDLVHLNDRITFPNPAQAAESQGDAYWKKTGPAIEVVDDLIYRNVANGALAVRRVPQMFMDRAYVGGPLGSTVAANLRFKNVLEEARALARTGGVTFWAEQAATDAIWVRFRIPQDRSRQVRFTDRNAGASEGRYVLAAATATTAIVAGQGEGAARTILERSRPSTWGRRIETFKDQRDTDDNAELEQSATEQLDEGAEGASAQFTVTEAPGLVYGVDYRLGDIVAVEVGALTITEPVRAVEIEWDGHGRTATLTLGDHDQADDKKPAWVSRIKNLDARVRGLEVR